MAFTQKEQNEKVNFEGKNIMMKEDKPQTNRRLRRKEKNIFTNEDSKAHCVRSGRNADGKRL